MNQVRLFAALGAAAIASACGTDTKQGTSADSGAAGGSSPAGNGGMTTASGGQPNTGGTNVGNGGTSSGGGQEAGTPPSGDGGLHIDHVFVVAMENHDQSQVIGDMTDAPYINGTLLENYASTSNFVDTLALAIPSEPHYVLMEAGANAFSDVTFTSDDNPSATNSTSSTEHLVTQMKNASPPVTWMSYQEGIDGTTGACPISSDGFYAPKHDPFIFFQDVSGAPPSATNGYCSSHHADLSLLDSALGGGHVPGYVFITPNLCNDMHGAGGCPNSNTIRSGDDWLSSNLKPIIDYSNANRGVIFVVWDEGSATLDIPFLAIGPTVKKGYVGKVRYTHGSLVKSIERIFGLPYMSTVAGENDFADLFQDGRFP